MNDCRNAERRSTEPGLQASFVLPTETAVRTVIQSRKYFNLFFYAIVKKGNFYFIDKSQKSDLSLCRIRKNREVALDLAFFFY